MDRGRALRVGLIGVPSSAGAHWIGQENGPPALRAAGLQERLEGVGLDVVDLGDTTRAVARHSPATRRAQNLESVVEVARATADMVREALSRDRVPLVIGGDCTITLGVLAAMIDGRSDVGVAYIDGSPDLNTPDDSPTGILDSMGAAHMLGLGDPRLRAVGPRDPMLTTDRIAFFGHERAVMNPAEAERLAGHVAKGGLSMSAAEARPRVGASARTMAAALGDLCGTMLVHFDVDVIDAIEFPGGNVAQFNTGLSFAEAADALAAFLVSPKLGAVVVTEFNAQRDPDGEQARRLLDALATGLRGHFQET